jgi:3' terminal RNA ribose 2'-O-methyltransferase Hen1
MGHLFPTTLLPRPISLETGATDRAVTWHHVAVLLTLTTTREPATDLGFLLVKHPDRVHRFDLPTGTAYVCFPEATSQRCTAALVLDVDPGRLGGRSGTRDDFTLGRFVNDRPYAASSLLSGAINRAFKSAMRGSSPDKPELAATAIPLEVHIPALRCRGGAGLAERLFAPLGWAVRAIPVPLDPTHPEWGDSRYLDLTLAGEVRLADALNQLYVLLPVCDDAKHYWVAPDEIEKLLRAGQGWLTDHPEQELITRRYLAHRRELATEAQVRLDALRAADDVSEPDTVDAVEESTTDEDAELSPSRERFRWPSGAGRRSGPRWSRVGPPACSTSAAEPGRCWPTWSATSATPRSSGWTWPPPR